MNQTVASIHVEGFTDAILSKMGNKMVVNKGGGTKLAINVDKVNIVAQHHESLAVFFDDSSIALFITSEEGTGLRLQSVCNGKDTTMWPPRKR